MKRRIQLLLEKAQTAAPAERVRESRALELLEHLTTPEAKGFLKELAKGADGAWLTEEARRGVTRLNFRNEPRR